MLVMVDANGAKRMIFQRKSYRKARWKRKAERMSDRTKRWLAPYPFTLSVIEWQ